MRRVGADPGALLVRLPLELRHVSGFRLKRGAPARPAAPARRPSPRHRAHCGRTLPRGLVRRRAAPHRIRRSARRKRDGAARTPPAGRRALRPAVGAALRRRVEHAARACFGACLRDRASRHARRQPRRERSPASESGFRCAIPRTGRAVPRRTRRRGSPRRGRSARSFATGPASGSMPTQRVQPRDCRLCAPATPPRCSDALPRPRRPRSDARRARARADLHLLPPVSGGAFRSLFQCSDSPGACCSGRSIAARSPATAGSSPSCSALPVPTRRSASRARGGRSTARSRRSCPELPEPCGAGSSPNGGRRSVAGPGSSGRATRRRCPACGSPGDYTASDYPATLEAAARSGIAAAGLVSVELG